MKAIKFSESIIINRSAEVVFDYTQDYTTRLTWDTFLQKADLMEDATAAGPGVKAYCVARNGLGMVTEYITFNRPKATAIKMTEGPKMFNTFLGSWTFKAITPKQTDVIFLYSFTFSFPFNLVGWLIRIILRNNVKQRLQDLKRCMES